MIKKLLLPVIALFCLLVPFAAVSVAADGVSPEDGSLVDLLRPVWDAATGGQWWLAASLGLVVAVALVKRYAPTGKFRDFVNSNMGASVMLLVGSFGGAVATGLMMAGTKAMSMAIIVPALKVAFAAAGGYALVKNLVVDPLVGSDWYKNKAPTVLKLILGVVTWMFVKSNKTVVAAEQAGDAAVAKNPATGVDEVVGKSTEL